MSRKSYLGGSTIIGPGNDPYRLENTPHDYTEDYGERPRTVFWSTTADDLFDELDGFDFLYLSQIFSSIQHAFVHGDLIAISRVSKEQEDVYLENYTLRVANKVMLGRRFDKRKGQIILQRSGKLEWDASQIVALYRAMMRAHDTVFDEAPSIHPDVQQLIDHRSAAL